MTNQEVINVLVNIDHTIAIIYQGVYDLIQTYENVMFMMDTDNNSLDEKISVLNTVIGDKTPGLSEVYEPPDVWMTIVAITSRPKGKRIWKI